MARSGAAIVSLLLVFGRAVAAPGQCPPAEEAKRPPPLQKLVDAALADRPGSLGALLRTPDLNACSGGASPLTQAAAAGRWPLVQALLERGARIDAPRDAASAVRPWGPGRLPSAPQRSSKSTSAVLPRLAASCSALVWAEAKQHAEIVDRLLAAGARR